MKKYLFILLSLIILISCQKKQKLYENNILEEEISTENKIDEIINELGYTDSITSAHRVVPAYRAYYEFKYGHYYYMLDYPTHIISQPNLQGEVIGILGMNSRIKIISIADWDSALEIDGVIALWYQIEYENITGYIWGGYISADTLIYDIDNNGVDDYFHYRVSRIQEPHYYYINALNDVVIYLNNIKIPTTNIYRIDSKGDIYRRWGNCSFKPTERNTVLIRMYFGTEEESWTDTFEMDAAGNIVLIEQIYKQFEFEE
jgi:hypothetical protein